MRNYLYSLAKDEVVGFSAGIIKFFLFVLSLVYGLAVRCLILFSRAFSCHFNCKVISVGNITLGGTGKTTLVEFIARYLKLKGHKVAIISRGYGRQKETMGDEPSMLLKKLGDIVVIVDANRKRAINKAIREYGIDTAILDDGFQQWSLRKSLEIAVIDATNPFGNSMMIPRGILREPLSSLKRADSFVLTKTNLHKDSKEIRVTLSKINPKAEIFEAMHEPLGFYNISSSDELFDADFLRGKSVVLFSGIGDPESFENLISVIGGNIVSSFRFGDHHNYNQKDLDRITTDAKDRKIEVIVTTEKDAARLTNYTQDVKHYKLLVLRIGLKINDEQGFCNRLLKLYSF